MARRKRWPHVGAFSPIGMGWEDVEPHHPPEWVQQQAPEPMKEISPMELLLRIGGRVAAVSGVIALIVWVTWVMLDVKNLQSGFTLPY